MDRPVSVADFYATILSALGVSTSLENETPEGRPISAVDKGGAAIKELVG